MYAIFACVKNKNRAVGPPCLDPLSFGRDDQPEPTMLARRGIVQLFTTQDEAEAAIIATLDRGRSQGFTWHKNFEYVILKCQPPASGEEEQ